MQTDFTQTFSASGTIVIGYKSIVKRQQHKKKSPFFCVPVGLRSFSMCADENIKVGLNTTYIESHKFRPILGCSLFSFLLSWWCHTEKKKEDSSRLRLNFPVCVCSSFFDWTEFFKYSLFVCQFHMLFKLKQKKSISLIESNKRIAKISTTSTPTTFCFLV